MILLDTDHLSVLQRGADPRRVHLRNKMAQEVESEFFASAISLEEQTRGWLAAINRTRRPQDQAVYYERLVGLFDFFADWEILPFDTAAANRFESLQHSRIRIGTMDLKIAAIALNSDALLLSANRQDFEQVPGLRVEDWLH
jgi:tRNA(fMet)-specific endonuclease VapC